MSRVHEHDEAQAIPGNLIMAVLPVFLILIQKSPEQTILGQSQDLVHLLPLLISGTTVTGTVRIADTAVQPQN